MEGFDMAQLAEILNALLMMVGGAAIIARWTPWPHDDRFIGKLMKPLKKLSDMVGQNHGRTANKDAP